METITRASLSCCDGKYVTGHVVLFSFFTVFQIYFQLLIVMADLQVMFPDVERAEWLNQVTQMTTTGNLADGKQVLCTSLAIRSTLAKNC